VRDRRWIAAVARRWQWLPLVFAAAYVVLLLTSLRSLVQSIYRDADVVSAPYIGELAGQAPHGAQIVLGNSLWFPALWFERLTHALPHHRQIWELAPWLASLAGVALVSWSTAKAAGRWAAAMVALPLACASPFLLSLQFGWSVHALVYVAVAALGAFVVLCVGGAGVIRDPFVHVGSSLVLAGLTAIVLASDKLLYLLGLAPFVISGVAMLWLVGGTPGIRTAVSVVVVAGLSVLGAVLIGALVADEHIVGHRFPVRFTTFDQIAAHVRLLFHSLASLFYGDFGGAAIAFSSVVKLVCAAVVFIGAVAGTRYVWRWSVAAVRGVRERGPKPAPVRAAHLVFWIAVATLGSLGYVFSNVPVDQTSARYVVPVAYGIAALLAVAAAGASSAAPRAALVGGTCVLLFGSSLALANRELQAGASTWPSPAVSGALADFLRGQGLRYGYGDYWVAAPLTWGSQASIQVYPVLSCGPTLCPFYLHDISSWYQPRPNTRTFLVADPLQTLYLSTPVPALGKPDQVAQVDGLTVYVYPYDIAARFRPVDP
jgi:hypothetical protein